MLRDYDVYKVQFVSEHCIISLLLTYLLMIRSHPVLSVDSISHITSAAIQQHSGPLIHYCSQNCVFITCLFMRYYWWLSELPVHEATIIHCLYLGNRVAQWRNSCVLHFPLYGSSCLPLIFNGLLCSVVNNNIKCNWTITFSIKILQVYLLCKERYALLLCVSPIYMKINTFVAVAFSKLFSGL